MRDDEALHGLPPLEVALDDLSRVFDGDPAVPDVLRVDDAGHTASALVQAARLVHAHDALQAALIRSDLQRLRHLAAAGGCAVAARVIRGAFVRTDEDVPLKARQGSALLVEDLLGEDQLLNLAGAFVDPQGALFAVEPLNHAALLHA